MINFSHFWGFNFAQYATIKSLLIKCVWRNGLYSKWKPHCMDSQWKIRGWITFKALLTWLDLLKFPWLFPTLRQTINSGRICNIWSLGGLAHAWHLQLRPTRSPNLPRISSMEEMGGGEEANWIHWQRQREELLRVLCYSDGTGRIRRCCDSNLTSLSRE